MLAINTVGEEIEAAADYCRSEGVGLEVTAFVMPANLERDTTIQVDRHRERRVQ